MISLSTAQVDKLVLKFRKFNHSLYEVAYGIDDSLIMKNQYFRDAYFQYDNAMYKLPEKLNDLSVTRAQLRALSKEVPTYNRSSSVFNRLYPPGDLIMSPQLVDINTAYNSIIKNIEISMTHRLIKPVECFKKLDFNSRLEE